jgi:hypothetical protein
MRYGLINALPIPVTIWPESRMSLAPKVPLLASAPRWGRK